MNLVDIDKDTALTAAAIGGHRESVNALVKAGADVECEEQ